MIGIDFIGPISPEAENGSKYILTGSDYFTKWEEAIPTINNYTTTVSTALFKARINTPITQLHSFQILMCIGLPRVVVTNNGREFDNKRNDEICKRLGIKRRFITTYHPQVGTQDVTCIIMIAQVIFSLPVGYLYMLFKFYFALDDMHA